MKIQNFKIKLFNLTKLYLLKYKIYNNFPITDSLILNFLTYTEFTLKQSLNLIYNYHLKKKKILFIGESYSKKNYNFLKTSGHISIPKSVLVNGSFKNNLPSNIISYKKKPNLVVFFDCKYTDLSILKQLDNLNIPVVIFGNSTISNCNKYYNIFSNSKQIELNNFFQFLVFSVIKTAKCNI